MNIELIIQEYKRITGTMIDKLNEDEDITEFMNRRDELIRNLTNDICDKEIVSKYLKEYEINTIDKKLEETINLKMKETKGKIDNLKKSKAAFNQYGNFNSNAAIFSTKR